MKQRAAKKVHIGVSGNLVLCGNTNSMILGRHLTPPYIDRIINNVGMGWKVGDICKMCLQIYTKNKVLVNEMCPANN